MGILYNNNFLNQLVLISNRKKLFIFEPVNILIFPCFGLISNVSTLYWSEYELFIEETESQLTKCPCGYQTF